MPHIVLTAFGSLGDLYPLIALGSGLRDNGYRVTIATSQHYGPTVAKYGLPFRALPPNIDTDDQLLMAKAMAPKDGVHFVHEKLIFPALADTVDGLLAICKDADLLISSALAYAARIVSDKTGLPWLTYSMCPLAFLSPNRRYILPGVPWSELDMGLLNGVLDKVVYTLALRETRRMSAPLFALRERLGLDPGPNPIFGGFHSERGSLALFSPLMEPDTGHWPSYAKAVGFLRFNHGGKVSDGTAEFLAKGSAPIVFTLGSGAIFRGDAFYEAALEASKRLGVRAILLTGKSAYAKFSALASGHEGIHVTAYEPYEDLLPRARIIVHQGGIGTCGEACHSGVPSLIVPFSHDQPDNAYRLKKLGVADTLSLTRLNPSRLEEKLLGLLKDDMAAQRSRELKVRIKYEDPLASIVAVIQKTLAAG